MVNPRQTITMQGVVVDLLITPSLYKRSLTDGLDLTLHNPDDAAEVWQIYVKHVYLAYRNALDVAAYDGHEGPRRVFYLADFEEWAAGEGKARFGELMRTIVEFKTGKTLEQITAEGKGGESKKKTTAVSLLEPWEPRRDWLIGFCGKTEREAEVTGWTELRALEKGYEEREHREWERARFIAHLNYLVQPVWGKGQPKERDPRKFHPFPWDDRSEKPLKADKQPTKAEIEKLNKIFEIVHK